MELQGSTMKAQIPAASSSCPSAVLGYPIPDLVQLLPPVGLVLSPQWELGSGLLTQSISQLEKKHFAAFLPAPPLGSSMERSDQGQILEGAGQLHPGAQLLAEPPYQAEGRIGPRSFVI